MNPPTPSDDDTDQITDEFEHSDRFPEQTLLARFSVSQRLAAEWAALSAVGFVTALFAFGGLYAVLTGQPEALSVRVESDSLGGLLGPSLLSLGLLVGVVVVHEFVHGAVMRRYGGDPRYGFGVAHFFLPYAYATTDESFTRNQFIVVALAPLVTLTVALFALAVVFRWSILLLPLALNVGGAVGDLWMTRLLLRYPETVRVVDETTGLAIYGDETSARPTGSPRGLLRRAAIGCGIGLGVSFFVLMVAPILLDVSGVTSLSVGPPDSPWSLYQFENGSGGVSSKIGGVGILACSAVFGLVYVIVSASAEHEAR